MSQEERTLDPQQRQALQEASAPAGLWPRIEEAARASLADAHQTSTGSGATAPSGSSVLRIVRGDWYRFAAAGLLGFFAFFGMQKIITAEMRDGARTSMNASGMHFVEHLRDDIPLFDEQGGVITPDADPAAWPEVVLATYVTSMESH
ncbi:MAG: hypothetical protein ACPG31_10585 [Planctomycetota bacterium]